MSLSAPLPEEIRSPADLELPPEADEVFRCLSPEGRKVFISEIFAALKECSKKDSLRPLEDLITAWYRSLILVSDPNHEDNMKWAAKSRPKKGLSLDEVRERIGL